MKAIVAMSGGVDSSVAAYLLKKQGLDVIGLSFELWDRRDMEETNVCCSIETINLARSVAEKLGIEHYTVDVRDAFYRYVIEEFCHSYLEGTTPNPCILCNKFIKFDFLLKKAEETGAGLIATGHYARVEKPRDAGSGKGRYLLKKGSDPVKDQSYVLHVMKQDEMKMTVFPLGEMTKEQTRRIAKELDLAGATRAESQEICFVGNDSYADFIKGFAPGALQPGRIVNTSGETVGEHRGIAFYTIGQRKGLGISSPSPHYVTHIDRARNIITVGSRKEVMEKSFKVKELNWISVEALVKPMRAGVKIRSTGQEKPAVISPDGAGGVFVEFDEPEWAPAPGQSAVFYDGDTVVGGGIIGGN